MLDVFRRDPNARQLAAGSTIFALGDPATEMFVVTEGTVELALGDRILEVVEPGGIFGEMALVDAVPRSAGARTTTGASIVPIDEKRFLYLIQNTPYFAIEVMKSLARRLRRMDAALEAG